jgi:hypothetical protein
MPSSRRSNKKIFISHSGRDRSFVLHLRRVLEQHRIPYWYSAEHIRGAQQWHDEIGRALDECNWFLVVLTPAAVRSLWVKRELFFGNPLNTAPFPGHLDSLNSSISQATSQLLASSYCESGESSISLKKLPEDQDRRRKHASVSAAALM